MGFLTTFSTTCLEPPVVTTACRGAKAPRGHGRGRDKTSVLEFSGDKSDLGVTLDSRGAHPPPNQHARRAAQVVVG